MNWSIFPVSEEPKNLEKRRFYCEGVENVFLTEWVNKRKLHEHNITYLIHLNQSFQNCFLMEIIFVIVLFWFIVQRIIPNCLNWINIKIFVLICCPFHRSMLTLICVYNLCWILSIIKNYWMRFLRYPE